MVLARVIFFRDLSISLRLVLASTASLRAPQVCSNHIFSFLAPRACSFAAAGGVSSGPPEPNLLALAVLGFSPEQLSLNFRRCLCHQTSEEPYPSCPVVPFFLFLGGRVPPSCQPTKKLAADYFFPMEIRWASEAILRKCCKMLHQNQLQLETACDRT